MLEPFLMLTVLNCFFMFSSTVTSCALWWQYRSHRHNVSERRGEDSKLRVKRTKSYENEILKDRKNLMDNNVDYVGSKSSMKKRKKANESKKDKNAKWLKFKTQGTTKEANDEEPRTLEKLTSTEDIRHRAASPSSETKSTIVMEVSTVQKVVQIFDQDRDYQHGRLPKETVTYRISPEIERKVEFVVQSKSQERT